jgi:hypothetical protein
VAESKERRHSGSYRNRRRGEGNARSLAINNDGVGHDRSEIEASESSTNEASQLSACNNETELRVLMPFE